MPPEFNSPSFRRNVATQQGQLREFTVGTPEEIAQSHVQQAHVPQREMTAEELDALERSVKEARKEKLSNMEKISDPAKRRIEILANIGRITKDVVLDGFTFSLRTLKSKETRDAALQSFKVDTNLELSFESRRHQLARSIFKIDGHEVAYILGDDSVETKLKFLDELEESVVLKLFDEFSTLKTEANSKFSINSETEAKEVAEDLKK